ncbi:unnamed protein product [Cochlearia groenlandica]
MDGDDTKEKEMDTAQEPEGVITRSRAKELDRDAETMIMKEELGGEASRSFFNTHIQAYRFQGDLRRIGKITISC